MPDKGTPSEPNGPAPNLPPAGWRLHLARWCARLALLGMLASLAYWELKTGHFQALVFAEVTQGVDYSVRTGPSPETYYPENGPYDERLGYTQIPEVTDRLTSDGWHVAEQARISERFRKIVEHGLFAPYHPKQRTGLTLRDPYGNRVHRARYPERYYPSFDAIPDLVVDTLRFVENRAILRDDRPRYNPALEPDRFLVVLLRVLRTELLGGDVPSGASTLATQLEKFQHSDEGQTSGYTDKLRQMLSASLRAYLDGPGTRDDQERIVTRYLNGVPLSAADGYGEVVGLGDGLHAWYGADFERINRLLRQASATDTRASPRDATLTAQARAYRRVLSLVIAQRRPTYFLKQGPDDLARLTDVYLRQLADAGMISDAFRDRALSVGLSVRGSTVSHSRPPQARRTVSYNLRTDLVRETGRESLYALDRKDMRVESTVDYDVQRAVARTLKRLDDPDFLERHRLDRWRLLADGDPSEVVYSFTLYEKGPEANRLRVQADTHPGPFNVNEGVKLNLGSTAKLRTLTTYLHVVAELYDSYADKSVEQLEALELDWRDRLARWVRSYLVEHPTAPLGDVLDRAMRRWYPADPDETFFTGGGAHRFENFSHEYDDSWVPVEKALDESINLVFVRLMRDIVRHQMFRLPESSPDILRRSDADGRDELLKAFAQQEGATFLRRFWRKYGDADATEDLVRLLGGSDWSADRLAVTFRAIRPDATAYTLNSFLNRHVDGGVEWDRVRELYEEFDPDEFNWNELGYLADLHPLELWLLHFRYQNPDASWSDVLAASEQARREAYVWLMESADKEARNQRIRIVLERRAFGQIHDHWQRLGYPFDELVPSYATALGSSADRPAALADLAGLVVNDGMRKPTIQFERIEMGRSTPYETELRRDPEEPERVMRPEVAERVGDAMESVVEDGTADKLQDYDTTIQGRRIAIGGKTGTGDNEREVRNQYGTLVESIPQNRTATFVFHLDDRFYGALTAYVPGKKSGDYNFTSGLAVRLLGILMPKLRPLWWRPSGATAPEKAPPPKPLAKRETPEDETYGPRRNASDPAR